ncbi:membrane protein [Sphaerisporangium melleum]|uniref:Membrane protein n=1 Tax=Sphaerisporangium melleum TaxID=321316 RepID=A0A917VMP5_9ACTN|nr:hemolysin family protein [Sphaerisporangium melleum]GGL00720.1 membrane protein [Sphaerisporangium melleum]GII71592.1 membrane protein [Sphaerisporangium melleum]
MIVDLIFLLGALALVIANGVFVAAEFSLVTVERGELQRLAAAGDRGAQGVLAAVGRLSFQLSGAQLGITITSLLLGVLAEPAVIDLLRLLFDTIPALPAPVGQSIAAVLGLLIATVGQMVLGELVPKNAALSRPLAISRVSVPPQRVFSVVFAPLIKVCNATANALVRALGAEPQDELASARSPDELSLLTSLSAEAGAMPATTAAMLRRALSFGDRTAGEAMTPRPDCVTVAAAGSVTEFLTLARRERHLRLPVSGDALDDIVGVASVVDAFAVAEDDRAGTRVAAIMRPPLLVPESLDLETVQERLFTAGREMAVVVDEYGGFAGVVTVEDLAEELIGDIADEYDLPEEVSAEPEGALLAPGSSVAVPALLRAHEVEERTGFQMPEGPYETLAGLLISRLGRIPDPGDLAEVSGWTLRADTVRRRRVEQITLTAPEEGEDR